MLRFYFISICLITLQLIAIGALTPLAWAHSPERSPPSHAFSASESHLETAVGGLAVIGQSPHCTAFFIEAHWLVSSSVCLEGSYESSFEAGFGLEESEFDHRYVFWQDGQSHEVSLESYEPDKLVAYFFSQEPWAYTLSKGYGLPQQMLSYSSYGVTRRSVTATSSSRSRRVPFFLESLFYYAFVSLESALGSPLVNAQGQYVGMHLGSIWHEGEDYGVGNRYLHRISPEQLQQLQVQSSSEGGDFEWEDF